MSSFLFNQSSRGSSSARRILILPFSFFMFFSFVLSAKAQDASSQIKSEIQRVQQSLKDKPLPEIPDIPRTITGALKHASDALAAGHLYVSLEQLGEAEDLLQGVRSLQEKKDAIKESVPAFEEEWGKANVQLTALNKSVQGKDWSHTIAAIQALSEAAQGRAVPLMEGSRGFATATGPKEGLFYMGEAQGQTAFAVFVSKLNAPRKTSQIPLRSLLPELEALQEKTNAAFQPPKSIEMHPRFIQLNSTIKFARELDSSKAYAGALYQYLEAVRHYGMLDPAVPDAAKQAALRSAVADELKKFSASRRDDSIAQIFPEKADAWLHKANGEPTSPDEWRAIHVVIDRVLPAYYAALKPAAPMQQRAARTTTLTLVRWPYT
jgi:hypothetical protein